MSKSPEPDVPVPCKPLPKEDLDHVLAHTREHWGEARGKSFFITGGTGFFGMWLLESFTHINDALELGMSATVLTRHPEAFAAKAPHLTPRADLRFIRGDIQSFDFPQGTFEYVVHAATAASAKLNKEDPLLMYDTITLGTRRVLQFAEGCGVKKLLLTSSGAVYGTQPTDISHLPEYYLGTPNQLSLSSAYGEGKRASEHMCTVHAQSHGYDIKIARCFAFVGPHLPLDAHFAIGNFIRDALNGNTIEVNGDGTPLRSYLYASDLVVWLWTMLLHAPSGLAFNVGSDEAISIRKVAEIVAALANKSVKVQAIRELDATGGISRYVPSIERARKELGLAIRVPLESSVSKTMQWHSKT